MPVKAFALILCVHYLQRSLFPQIERALAPGGMLLFETYTCDQLEFDGGSAPSIEEFKIAGDALKRAPTRSAGGPRNPEYLLSPGELRDAFPSLRLVFYRELRAGTGIASLIAQKPVESKRRAE